MPRIFVALILIAFCRAPANAQERRPSFGERQLEQLLDDRPSMRSVVPVTHPIYRWAVEKFERGALGDRVYWDHHEPMAGAEHVFSTPSVVRVESGAKSSGRDKWSMLIFELINFERAEAVGVLRWKAVRNEVDRNTFVMATIRLEVDAMRQTQQFFKVNPMPNADRGSDTYYFSLLSIDADFDAYLRFLKTGVPKEYDLLTYYGMVYDELNRSRQ